MTWSSCFFTKRFTKDSILQHWCEYMSFVHSEKSSILKTQPNLQRNYILLDNTALQDLYSVSVFSTNVAKVGGWVCKHILVWHRPGFTSWLRPTLSASFFKRVVQHYLLSFWELDEKTWSTGGGRTWFKTGSKRKQLAMFYLKFKNMPTRLISWWIAVYPSAQHFCVHVCL